MRSGSLCGSDCEFTSSCSDSRDNIRLAADALVGKLGTWVTLQAGFTLILGVRAPRLGFFGGVFVLTAVLILNFVVDRPSASVFVLYVCNFSQVLCNQLSNRPLTGGTTCQGLIFFYWHGGVRSLILGFIMLVTLQGARAMQGGHHQ